MNDAWIIGLEFMGNIYTSFGFSCFHGYYDWIEFLRCFSWINDLCIFCGFYYTLSTLWHGACVVLILWGFWTDDERFGLGVWNDGRLHNLGDVWPCIFIGCLDCIIWICDAFIQHESVIVLFLEHDNS